MVFESISRGIDLIKLGLGVIKDDKFLLAFPVISGTMIVLIFLSIMFPVAFFGMVGILNPLFLVPLVIVVYFLIYFIGIYFNVAIIACATIRLNGGTPKFSDGISAANENLGSIFAWSMISATVGLILQALSRKAGILGKIAIFIIGASWNMLTFFVLPVMIYEKTGAWASTKRSLTLFKATWGESMVAMGGLSIIFALLALLGIPLIFIGFMSGSLTIILVCLILAFVYWIGLAVVSTTVRSVLLAALYRFARTGMLDKGIPQWVVR